MSPHTSHTIKSRSEARLPSEEEPEFQIAPMIDILLVLLVFFLSISSTEVLQLNKAIILPVAGNAPLEPYSAGQTIVNVMWVTMNNTGSIEWNGRIYAQPTDMLDALRVKARANPEMHVLIRADRDVRYEYLKQVMVTAARAGIGKIAFAVVDKKADISAH